MTRLISSLIVAFLSLYYGILYQNTFIITIAYALFLLIGISVLEVVYCYFNTECHLEIPVSLVEADKPVDLVCRITNKGYFGGGRMELLLGVSNFLTEKPQREWLAIPQLKKGTQAYDFELSLYGAGRYDITVSKLRLCSSFGLFALSRKCHQEEVVLILPGVYAIPIEMTETTRNFIGDADIYDEFRPGHDGGESFSIREYRPKDKLQSIHWKLSAKTDDLMVKENSHPKACAIVLLLEAMTHKGNRAEDYMEGYLEMAASMSYSMMDRRIPHFVAWFSKQTQDVRRIRVDDEESFYLFLSFYINDGAIEDTRSIRDAYIEKYKNEIYHQDICINTNLEIFRNGQQIHRLDVEKIQDECERLELLL